MLAALGLFTIGLVGGASTGRLAFASSGDPYAGLERLARVLATVESDYVEPVTNEDLVASALQGIAAGLDEHTRMLSADELRDLREGTQGGYEGIGVAVVEHPEGVQVETVFPGSPARRDGFAVGDVFVAVGDTPLAGLSLAEVAALLKGPRGSTVVVSVARDGWDAPRRLSTVRDRIETPGAEAAAVGDGIVYARVLHFQQHVAEELSRLVLAEADGDLTGLVLDLRDNPGGLLDEAVAIADLFLDDGPIVSTRGRLEGEIVHPATVGGLGTGLPLVVLVNSGSASASEIVAGALQDTGRAVLVGEHTYGKGSVQTLYEQDDGSALKLTIARYYTPSGAPVAPKQGREPDVVVDAPRAVPPLVELRQRVEGVEGLSEPDRTDLLERIDALPMPTGALRPIPWDRPPAERLALQGDPDTADPQLARALAELRRMLPTPTGD